MGGLYKEWFFTIRYLNFSDFGQNQGYTPLLTGQMLTGAHGIAVSMHVGEGGGGLDI